MKTPAPCPWFTIRNAATADAPTEILLYGEIGRGWDGAGTDTKDFARALDEIPQGKEILLRIHSPGGSVFDGLALYAVLLRRRAHLTARVDGVALSAASFVAMAARRIEMPGPGRMMIHDAQGLAIGDSASLREMADLLDRESDNIAGIYAERTGNSHTKCRALMEATTWMDANEAVALGFADAVLEAPALKNAFDLSRFRVVPERETRTQPTGHPTTNTQNNASTMEATTIGIINETSTVPAAPPAPPLPNPIDITPQLTALQNRVAAAEARERTGREARIRRDVQNLAATRPQIDVERDSALCIANEGALEILRRLPEAGSPPIRPSGVTNSGNPLIEAYNKLRPGADRARFRVENHAELVAVRRQFDPRNANTLAAGLVNDYLTDGLLVVFTNKLAVLGAFASSFTADRTAPRRSVDVPIANSGSSTVTNGTNFETGDSNLGVVTVAMSHYAQPFHLDNNAINQGHKLQNLAEINALVLANSISDVYTALMVAANYGTATTIGAASAFDSADLPAILALAKNYRKKILLLDGGHLAYLLPKDRTNFALGEGGAYGFDAIFEQNRWTSGVANIAGFVCGPDAIACASALPAELPAGEYLTMGTTEILNGLTVQNCTWFSRATRFHWASFDVVFGAAVGNGAAAENLVTA